MIWRHVSTEIEYREPLGALPTEGTVKLSLLGVQEYKEEAVDYEVALLMGDSYGNWQEQMMEPQRLDEKVDLATIQWSCIWTAPTYTGVHWYYFRIRRGDNLFFYGSAYGRNSGPGEAIAGVPGCYQMTVYEKDYETPEWFRNATMYQIFPDRFARGRKENLRDGIHYHKSMGRKVYEHQRWEEIPYYNAMSGEEYYNPSDFFGGDLEGIRQNLSYLKEMGITCIYLNPIVESDSNHRYNTADYKKVDPILGTEEDFKVLCEEAGQMGMRIMLDGVFSHTGADSIYFNKKGNYPEPGAYQEAPSPYDSWYTFDGGKERYRSWWGFDSLPEVNELDPIWQQQIIRGEDSVFRYWLDMGAGGFRLDVADELPDLVIELMRIATKQKDADKVLLGEVWEDATLKEAYGQKRTYALGKGLDSVMNYPFRNATLAWLTGWSRAEELAVFLNAQNANYPQPMYYALMNLLSSHDVARIRTVLGAGTEGKDMSRQEQADYVMDYKADRYGMRMSRLAMALQFVLPGVPSVYYGDEYGMAGFNDPFNRGTLEKRDRVLAEYVKKLSLLRREHQTLRTGGMSARAYGEQMLAVLRVSGTPEQKEGVFLTLLNCSQEEDEIEVSLADFTEGLTAGQREALKQMAHDWPGKIGVEICARERMPEIELIEAEGKESWKMKVSLPPIDAVVIRIQ